MHQQSSNNGTLPQNSLQMHGMAANSTQMGTGLYSANIMHQLSSNNGTLPQNSIHMHGIVPNSPQMGIRMTNTNTKQQQVSNNDSVVTCKEEDGYRKVVEDKMQQQSSQNQSEQE